METVRGDVNSQNSSEEGKTKKRGARGGCGRGKCKSREAIMKFMIVKVCH